METVQKQRFKDTLDSLNETQRECVLSDIKTLQILAGPGSGKTRVLTCRVAYFVIEKRISPSNIVVVTFTNKAADEMKKRLRYLIGDKNTEALIIGTFHAICCRILHLHAKIVDLDPSFAVADTDKSRDIITELRKDKQLNISDFTRSKMNAGAIYGMISKAKNHGETCFTYAAKYGTEFKTKDIAVLFTRYEAELKRLNLVDFDNLLSKTNELFRKKKDVLSRVQTILVDEYQDTNIVQYDLVKLMTMQVNNKMVTIVGDPDQSIFGFRNAVPRNFLKMQEDFTDVGVINMEQNYRSSGTILKAALHVIKQDSSRFNKTLRTDNPDGKPIVRISTDNEESQAEMVAGEIKNVIEKSNGLIEYKDIAILIRMNYMSRHFESVFRREKIPYAVVGGDRFFNRVEIKDILSYLNFAYNPKDLLSFNRIINVPKRGIGEAKLKKIFQTNENDKTNLLDTIINIANSKSRHFNASVKSKLLDFGSVCTTIKEMMNRKRSIPDIIQYLLDAIKYIDYLKEYYFQDHEARWDNIGELISVAQKTPIADDGELSEFVIVSDEESDGAHNDQATVPLKRDSNQVADFLEYCSLCSNQKELEEAEGGKVVIATLHASKGLEWPCVFIATCNNGVIPHNKSYTPSEVEEECRLLYVGITRSKFLLYCISPRERDIWGASISDSPSPFLEGMKNEIYSTEVLEWDDETRLMLAKTIGKEVPPKNYVVKKRPSDNATSSQAKLMKFGD